MLQVKITANDIHEIVDAFSAALDAKNSYTSGHSERVAEISLLLAAKLGLAEAEQNRIHIGGHLHDIGKIGVPDSILNKPGKLTSDEFKLICQHPDIGYHIIQPIHILKPIADIVKHHHERFDGKGYPDGLAGNNISLGARIVAVADALDAMTSPRSYRQPFSISRAIDELKRCAGTQFDPTVVDTLLELVHDKFL